MTAWLHSNRLTTSKLSFHSSVLVMHTSNILKSLNASGWSTTCFFFSLFCSQFCQTADDRDVRESWNKWTMPRWRTNGWKLMLLFRFYNKSSLHKLLRCFRWNLSFQITGSHKRKRDYLCFDSFFQTKTYKVFRNCIETLTCDIFFFVYLYLHCLFPFFFHSFLQPK